MSNAWVDHFLKQQRGELTPQKFYTVVRDDGKPLEQSSTQLVALATRQREPNEENEKTIRKRKKTNNLKGRKTIF